MGGNSITPSLMNLAQYRNTLEKEHSTRDGDDKNRELRGNWTSGTVNSIPPGAVGMAMGATVS